MNDDIYEILGIEQNASQEEIRKAYLRAAAIWHPDKCDKEESHEMFQKISKAYEILSNEDNRRHHNNLFGNKFSNHRSEVFSISDFTESSKDVFSKECRCGESYEITLKDISEGYTVISCAGCSLSIQIV